MAKYNVTRLLETAKPLATEAGEQLSGVITYLADFVENVSRCLRGGLSFSDNFNCEVRTVSVKDNVATVIGASKPVVGVIPTRVLSSEHHLTSFGWYYNSAGELTVQIGLTGTPTDSQKVTLVLLF